MSIPEISGGTGRVYGGDKLIAMGGCGFQPTPDIFYYQFKNNLNDTSGNNRNYSVSTGSVTYGTIGKYNYVQIPRNFWTNRLDFSGNNQMTISGRAYGDTDAPNEWGIIYDMSTSSSLGEMYRISVQQGGTGLWGIPTGVTPPVLGLGEWHNLVMTFDGSTHKIYYNGEFVTISDRSTTNRSIQSKINNARDTSSTTYSGKGRLSEIMGCSGIWTDEQIRLYFLQNKSEYGK